MKPLRIMFLIVISCAFLASCSYETKEYRDITYVTSYKIDRGSDEHPQDGYPYMAIIFKTSANEELVLYDDADSSKTSLVKKDRVYNVSVSISNRFYYGNAIVSIEEVE